MHSAVGIYCCHFFTYYFKTLSVSVFIIAFYFLPLRSERDEMLNVKMIICVNICFYFNVSWFASVIKCKVQRGPSVYIRL